MYQKIIPLVLICFLAACSSEDTSTSMSPEKPVIYTVNYPLAYFADRIAGQQYEVVFPEMEGDPAFWEPKPEALAGFQQADWILLNGANYAKWLGQASLPQSRMVDTSAAFADQYIEIEGGVAHSHGDGEAHMHGVAAFTTWLNLKFAVKQAEAIEAILDLEEAGFAALKSDLLALDQALDSAFAPLSDEPLIGSHPVYQYLAERYGLNLRSLHWEPDTMPDASMWAELESLRENHGGSILLWEGTPLPEIVERLDGMGIQSVVFDPCGNRPESGDFLSVMRENLNNIEALKK